MFREGKAEILFRQVPPVPAARNGFPRDMRPLPKADVQKNRWGNDPQYEQCSSSISSADNTLPALTLMATKSERFYINSSQTETKYQDTSPSVPKATPHSSPFLFIFCKKKKTAALSLPQLPFTHLDLNSSSTTSLFSHPPWTLWALSPFLCLGTLPVLQE